MIDLRFLRSTSGSVLLISSSIRDLSESLRDPLTIAFVRCASSSPRVDSRSRPSTRSFTVFRMFRAGLSRLAEDAPRAAYRLAEATAAELAALTRQGLDVLVEHDPS